LEHFAWLTRRDNPQHFLQSFDPGWIVAPHAEHNVGGFFNLLATAAGDLLSSGLISSSGFHVVMRRAVPTEHPMHS